ncbi:hypothetical protein [Pedobacter psychroterrae]|uniref:Uncharacterized protein n=1 Tax=Pedobacter psychroterrae TaxID=2530453 RepID=A0A4R0NNK1_9SPHI|nr:hypothetical protein [Pedobacter psychroterrae]TCD01223.1 hypothetical protein EZ437_10725 [Pedobacter psychroterrae]
MSFDEKLNNYFTNFSLQLGPKPTENLIYLYADYVELVTLFSNSNFVSATDILDRLKDEGVFVLKEKDNNTDDEDKDRAEVNDKYEIFMDQIFRLINERANLFGSDYPFLVHNDKIILEDKKRITERHRVYIFLLLSSSLNIFSLFQPELTTEFEIVCFEVLKNFLPDHAIVKSFGKKSDYQGSAVQKIQALADDLKIKIDEDGFNEISKKGNQEKGLDLIGWIPFDDIVPNFLAILAQCACGKDWNKKLHETSRYNNYMRFHRLNPLHSMFIPYSLVSYLKPIFFRNDEIDNRLIFERKRILNYLNDLTFFQDMETRILIDKCIEFEEAVI